MVRRLPRVLLFLGVVACATPGGSGGTVRPATTIDSTAFLHLARTLAADSLRGRGPWTSENTRAARILADQLSRLGAKPVFGSSLLVPFVTSNRPQDTVYNVAAIIPARGGATTGELIGITGHLDHLGVGRPDAAGDSIYNGFFDDALPVAIVVDVARRYARAPGDRPLLVIFFNLEERGLLGSKDMVARTDAGPLLQRIRLMLGVDAGAPAGEALQWQLMGTAMPHAGSRLADSLAQLRGWSTTLAAPRAISDVFPFSQHGVPILFPIPGPVWKGYTEEQHKGAMARFDHYHQPGDQYNRDFPLIGTLTMAEWLWDIIREATDRRHLML